VPSMDLDASESNSLCAPGRGCVRFWKRLDGDLRKGVAPQIVEAQRRWSCRIGDRRIRQRSSVAELRPDMRAASGARVSKTGQPGLIGKRSQHHVSWFLRVSGIDLHLADNRKRGTACRPSLIQPNLLIGWIARAVTERIGHRCFDQPILQNNSTPQLERRTKGRYRYVRSGQVRHVVNLEPTGAVPPLDRSH
jgi:hypothetical protein